jgi:GntR family transcriptional regulator/MocR family aminotransferase
MDTLFELKLEPPAPGKRRSGGLLFAQLRDAILDGRLAQGLQLPASRQAERFFGLSRNTIARVYGRLTREALTVAHPGSGTYVKSRRLRPLQGRGTSQSSADPRLNPVWLRPDIVEAVDFWREPRAAPRSSSLAPVDFRPALIDSRLFPFDVFRQVSVKQLRRMERKPAIYRSPQGNQGHFPLRKAIAQHIAVTRTIVCEASDVLVTAGAQQAFDILARILVTPGGTVVAVENPGYPPMRAAFAAAGATIVPVGVDHEGLIVDALPPNVRVICVCPSHQFPLGVAMSLRRRKALLDYAQRRGVVIIEDDYDGEFRYDASPFEALQSQDSADLVFYVGTFSKCMLPALRLGFIVAPRWAMRTMITAKNCLDWHCPTPIQMGVAQFIADGHLTRHVRKLRSIYLGRRKLLLDILAADFAGRLAPILSCYGMHVAVIPKLPHTLDRVEKRLLRLNVKVHTLERYFLGAPTSEGLIIGFGTTDLPEIERGLSALSRVLT